MQSSASYSNNNNTSVVSNESSESRAGSVNADTQHPFANSTAKLELIPTTEGIDLEAEANLYDDLCRTYEDDTEQFTGSNISTPAPAHPYKPYKSTKPKHSRNLSLLPAESVFSADIFLADNTSPSSSASSPLFAQDVTITGWTTVGDKDKARKAGAYIAYDCAIVTREGTTMHILKRYTAFEELHGRLKRTLPPSTLPFLPSLPPKAPLARFRPAFLDSRRKLLQFWLASVLLHPEIGGREVVRDWVLS